MAPPMAGTDNCRATDLTAGTGNLDCIAELTVTGNNYAGMYALILITGILGLALNAALERPERRLLRWHPTYRPEAGR